MKQDYVSGPADGQVPLHRLNTPLTKAWLCGGQLQKALASQLARQYRGGCGVLSATNRLFAYVQPDGRVRELSPPFQSYEMWQIANRPLVTECQCAAWYDPESGGAWRDRGSSEHHPVCQFDRTSLPVYKRIMVSGHRVRPDAWTRFREEVKQR